MEINMPNDQKEIRIVIAQRGWVFVGEYSIEGDNVIIDNGGTIRHWGTTKGLGEIAAGGPTETTIIDRSPRVTLHRLAVVATIDANADKWSSYVGR